ncbi:DUF397 domain-containing protein [Streptomyces sp. T1317-0309]|nr:DUF397 domain-containing protein [Streptomyces sp. T1317-0309]
MATPAKCTVRGATCGPRRVRRVQRHGCRGAERMAWQKSRHSNSQGSCVEFARCPGRRGGTELALPRRARPGLHLRRSRRCSGRQGRRVRPSDRLMYPARAGGPADTGTRPPCGAPMCHGPQHA